MLVKRRRPDSLIELLERSRTVVMTPAQREAQRQSFAYGNARIEDDLVTREAVREAAERLKAASE